MRKKQKIEHLKATFGKLKEDSFPFQYIERYFENKDQSNSFQVISDKTCNDLDFDELFMFLDRTTSKIGQQFLYNQLRTLPNSNDNLTQKEKLINQFQSDEKFRLATQMQLINLNNPESYYICSIFQDAIKQTPSWFFLVKILSLANLLALISVAFFPPSFFIFLGITTANILLHYWNKKNLDIYLGLIPQLFILNNVAKKLAKQKEFEFLETKINDSLKALNKVKKKMLLLRMEASLQGDFQSLIWGIIELFKIIFILEPIILFRTLKRLNRIQREIETIFNYVGEIDAILSIASLRKGSAYYCIPTIKKQGLNAIKVYHPLIPNCIANSIQINDKSALLTGSNMSGKTSFIRTIGINYLTGLTLNTCFAESISITKSKIYSAIRINDDLINDKSYYFEEVVTVKEMMDKSSENEPHLFLLDEIFKGTNTIERIAAGKAVLSHLTKNGNIVFVSTHDIELTDLLKKEYDLYHFSEIIKNDKVDFDYQIKEGILSKRNALRILEINGYPEEVIKEANCIAKELDKATLL